MGINGFWELVRPAAVSRLLTAHVVEHISSDADGKPFRIRIDASLWFYQAQRTFAIGHAQSGENPELRLIFFRLARLFRLPILPYFVFDGPQRPDVKRGKKVVHLDHWLTERMRTFIEAFGFQSHSAPAEAEAELARMNALGIIDAILTDDSDAFIFGARCIIRNPNVKLNKDSVIIYTLDSIQAHVDAALTGGGLLLVALLCGGDYDPAGLPGCGPQMACRLARYGLGDSLLKAAQSVTTNLEALLPEWRETLRTCLRDDPCGHLGRCHRVLAAAIPVTFPAVGVIRSYASPLSSYNVDGPHCLVAPHCMPTNLAAMARLCEHHFTWGTEAGILNKFSDLIWPGVVLRALCPHAIIGHSDSVDQQKRGKNQPLQAQVGGLSMTSDFSIHSANMHHHTLSYKISVRVPGLIRQVQDSLCGLRQVRLSNNKQQSAPASTQWLEPDQRLSVWIPKPLLLLDQPAAVHEYEQTRTCARSRVSQRNAAHQHALTLSSHKECGGAEYASTSAARKRELEWKQVDVMEASIAHLAPRSFNAPCLNQASDIIETSDSSDEVTVASERRSRSHRVPVIIDLTVD